MRPGGLSTGSECIARTLQTDGCAMTYSERECEIYTKLIQNIKYAYKLKLSQYSLGYLRF